MVPELSTIESAARLSTPVIFNVLSLINCGRRCGTSVPKSFMVTDLANAGASIVTGKDGVSPCN